MTDIRVIARIQSNVIRVKARLENITLNTGVGGNVDIRNSNSSFFVTATSSPFTLDDTNVKIYVNGTLKQTFTRPSMVSQTINITPAP